MKGHQKGDSLTVMIEFVYLAIPKSFTVGLIKYNVIYVPPPLGCYKCQIWLYWGLL